MAKTKISKHFYDYEVRKSSTAVANQIDNTPPKEIMDNATAFAKEVMDKVRDYYNHSLTPNSWYRCEELEKILAASGYKRWLTKRGLEPSDSNWTEYFNRKQHPKGIACDIKGKRGQKLSDTYKWMRDNLEYDQLIIEGYKGSDIESGWIHISWNPNGENRKQAFSITDA